jgi:hypothetical protein
MGGGSSGGSCSSYSGESEIATKLLNQRRSIVESQCPPLDKAARTEAKKISSAFIRRLMEIAKIASVPLKAGDIELCFHDFFSETEDSITDAVLRRLTRTDERCAVLLEDNSSGDRATMLDKFIMEIASTAMDEKIKTFSESVKSAFFLVHDIFTNAENDRLMRETALKKELSLMTKKFNGNNYDKKIEFLQKEVEKIECLVNSCILSTEKEKSECLAAMKIWFDDIEKNRVCPEELRKTTHKQKLNRQILQVFKKPSLFFRTIIGERSRNG